MNNKTFSRSESTRLWKDCTFKVTEDTYNKSNATIFGVDANIIIFGYRPWCKQPLGLI